MATLVLGAVGSAVGGAIGGTVMGISAAQIGGFVGAAIGQQIDAALLSHTQVTRHEGPRLSDINITASTEGAPIPRVWGRVRLAGQLLWATNFKETVTTTTETHGGGGKGFGGGGGTRQTVETTTYSYSISFALGLCEGPVTRIGRVWADGKPLDLSRYITRFYPGSQAQLPDPLIEQIEGAGNTPAYRGLAYLVFDDFPLAQFGNRIPQLQVEVVRALHAQDPSAADNIIQGVDLIPGSGEFVLATDIVKADDGYGGTTGQNKNNNLGVADLTASLDSLEALLPNCRSVVLVVAWFGDDLRCGTCSVRPKVEIAVKTTSPFAWSVNGIDRGSAAVVSADGEGRPVFGGTPADWAVIQAIQALKARGIAVHFYPFLLMDIPVGNSLPDPYSDNAATIGQPAFPWRGRITCAPAAGFAGTVDKTSAAAEQVAAFFGTASLADYAVTGTSVAWTGGADWGFRRMVLHYAHLCAAAGGVDSFLLGSELEGVTKVRSAAGTYPAVSQLVSLLADVRAILPTAALSYAANWTEFQGHRPTDGSGDVYFHLDPFWSNANVGFVGIDYYMPLADWRDGDAHLDYVPGRRLHDLSYLKANVEGGEYYDFTYATDADRDAQTRTPVTDPGGHGEPWVFRFKDLRGWWANAHHDRPAGVRSATPTAWVPASKPLWLTELGCPAVEKGANQPNVFVDPKSAESALPNYSNGRRDDLIQRRYIEALLQYWIANNPVSAVYGAPMIDLSRAHVWSWDARSYPDFPARATVWTDAPNWRLGHWLNGRIGLVPLADLIADLCAYAGFDAFDASNVAGLVTGFLVDRTMSVREALTPLMTTYQFDACESQGLIRFVARGGAPVLALGEDDLVLAEGRETRAGYQLTRAQETDLPLASRLTFIDATADYRQTEVMSRRLVGASDRVAVSSVPLVLEQSFAQALSDAVLQEAWVARERAQFALPPSRLALDPSDAVDLDVGGRSRRLQLTDITDAVVRKVVGHGTDPSLFALLMGPERDYVPPAVNNFGRPLGVFLDLPILSAGVAAHAPYFAAYAAPWPGAVLLYRSASSAGFSLDGLAAAPAKMGATTSYLYAGPLWRFDRVNDLYVTLIAGTLESRSELEVLNGANALALQNQDGDWEILQFTTAELLAPHSYKLSGLLRGLGGTEGAMKNPVPAGARLVFLDNALIQPGLTFDQRALTFTYRYGPSTEEFSDPAYVEETRAFESVGLRPYAPAAVRGRRDQGSGDWTLSWMRRTRIGGDDWAQPEVPLGEESEAYDIEIYDVPGTTLKRTLTATEASVPYSAAGQTADFGSPQWNFTVRVYQRSATFGRGPAAQALIWHY